MFYCHSRSEQLTKQMVRDLILKVCEIWGLGVRGFLIKTIRLPGTFCFSTIPKAKYVKCQKISLYPVLAYPMTSPPRQTGHMNLLFWIDNHKETIIRKKENRQMLMIVNSKGKNMGKTL